MVRILAACLLAFASPAFAGTICAVDFQKAVTETNEGKSAQTKIDGMFKSRQDEMAKMQADFEKTVADFQKRAPMLAAEARAAEEQKLMGQQRSLQQTAMQYEQEMQQTYMSMLGDLDAKMRTVAADVGKNKACSVVLDSAVVVYAGADVTDVTLDLVARYNSVHQ